MSKKGPKNFEVGTKAVSLFCKPQSPTNMTRYIPIITAFLKRPLMLAALVCLLSCGGRQEATPPADHTRQADSLVAACKGLDALQAASRPPTTTRDG